MKMYQSLQPILIVTKLLGIFPHRVTTSNQRKTVRCSKSFIIYTFTLIILSGFIVFTYSILISIIYFSTMKLLDAMILLFSSVIFTMSYVIGVIFVIKENYNLRRLINNLLHYNDVNEIHFENI